jgi:hypothetical protein
MATVAQLHSDSYRVAEWGYSLGQVLHVMKTTFKIFSFHSKLPMTLGMQMMETALKCSYFDVAKNLCSNFVVCRYHLPDTRNMAVEHGDREHACAFGCITDALHISKSGNLLPSSGIGRVVPPRINNGCLVPP